MFWISARIVPNAGLRVRRSELTLASAPSTRTSVPTRMCECSSPLGPFTRTRPSSTATVTPLGIATGRLPILDIALPLPDLAHELAAQPGLAGLALGHQTARRGQDAGAEAAHDARNFTL